MRTMMRADQTPEAREAMRIFRSFPPDAQRDLVNFLRGAAFGRNAAAFAASASPAPQAAPDPRVRIGA